MHEAFHPDAVALRNSSGQRQPCPGLRLPAHLQGPSLIRCKTLQLQALLHKRCPISRVLPSSSYRGSTPASLVPRDSCQLCPLHHFQFICLCPHRVPSLHACRSPSKDIYLGSALSEGSAVARVCPLAAKGSHSHCSKNGCDSRMAISACLPWDKAVCQEGLLNDCITEDGNKRVCAQVSPR